MQQRTLDDLIAEVYESMNQGDQGMASLENFIRQSMIFNILAETAIKAKLRSDQLCGEFCENLGSGRLTLKDRIARQTGLPDPNAAYGPYDPVVRDRRVG